ncbi:hypothetical protein BDV98DRAFT_568194 [Pterulicium gracile]|uniref:Uncharacterized protein n=1 Tax=Pterulicium gracile TaxID=1884261 RepID=A0A5C3QG37_9AGAR|nr:hypothetical protein BDV98DRAFT_568194 [Pterula gracilis]
MTPIRRRRKRELRIEVGLAPTPAQVSRPVRVWFLLAPSIRTNQGLTPLTLHSPSLLITVRACKKRHLFFSPQCEPARKGVTFLLFVQTHCKRRRRIALNSNISLNTATFSSASAQLTLPRITSPTPQPLHYPPSTSPPCQRRSSYDSFSDMFCPSSYTRPRHRYASSSHIILLFILAVTRTILYSAVR